MDGNETAKKAAVRETKEEAGLAITENDLDFAHVMHRRSDSERAEDSGERVDFFFKVKRWNGEPRNAEPEKCDDMRWFPLDQLPENTVPYIRFAIENIMNGVP